MPKKSEKLTEMEVRTAQAADKDYKLYDENGLRLLVRKSGTKVWQLPYRFRNKSNIYTIGQYIHPIQAGYVGLKEARLTCYEIRGLLNQGIDPNANKKAKSDHVGKEKTTFEFLAREWHAKGVWVSKHAKNILKSLEEDVFSSIGQKQITEITRLDIVHVLEKIEARDACDVAKRVCQRCVAIFDYAITKGICDDNPAIGRAKFIRKAKSKARPFLKEEELPEFLQKLFDYHGRNYIQMAVHFLLLTFVRPGELRHAEWKEIDFERALWKIPAERMKMERDHVVPLSFQSLALLRKLHDVTGNNLSEGKLSSWPLNGSSRCS